jgi:hypothetical protein
MAMDEDEGLGEALDTDLGAVAVAASAPTTTTPAPPAMDDDDQEMWDIMHELEQDKKEKLLTQPLECSQYYSSFPCDSREHAKVTRALGLKLPTKWSTPMAVGAPVSSLGYRKYYVTFSDDHTR